MNTEAFIILCLITLILSKISINMEISYFMVVNAYDLTTQEREAGGSL